MGEVALATANHFKIDATQTCRAEDKLEFTAKLNFVESKDKLWVYAFEK